MPSSERRRRRIDELISSLDLELPNRDLALRLIEEALTISTAGFDRLDLKIVNATLAELNHAFELFSPYRTVPKVTIFGSARTNPDEPCYQMAKEFAATISNLGWMVVTGGGPGIMAAGISGAGSSRSFGINIRLPFETPFLEVDGEVRLIEMKYFFTRKLMLMKESDAFVSFPGGLGTLDETFELLTLMQTGKAQLAPVVLADPENFGYWKAFVEFLEVQTVRRGLVSEGDLSLFRVRHSIDDTVSEIVNFYRNFKSMRWVDDTLIMRLRFRPSPGTLTEANLRFSDIVVSGDIAATEPSPHEIADRDQLDLPRISLKFNRRSYARLRALIDFLSASDQGMA